MAKKLLDQVRDVLRTRHYSYRTEEAYVDWIRRFILFHNKRHPAEMGAPEIQAFLTHLAREKNVSASTQNPCTEPVEVRPSLHSSSSTAKSSTKKSNLYPCPAPNGQNDSPPSSHAKKCSASSIASAGPTN